MTQSDLDQFCGTENYHRHWLGLDYTDGVKYLADTAGAYWLLDIICSYQNESVIAKNQRLQEFQLWELKVKDGKGVVICKGDSTEKPVITQKIPFTDFPLPYVKIYVENKVILLPSEH